jgi:hypothetical protein
LAVLRLVRLENYSVKLKNMATYGRGQMLGSGINPESFKQDYSGFANAAATQAQGVANLGANIGGAIAEVGDYFKKQAEDEKKVQKSLSVAKAIGDLIPGLKPTIQDSLNILNDKEIPLSRRTAEADAIADILNLGINEVRNREDVGFKERELGIREAQFMADNAPSQRTVNLQQGEITETINGKQYKVPITFNPATGETRRLDGSVVGGGSPTSEAIDTGLNLPMPTAEGTAMPGDGTFPDYGGISEAMVLPPRINPAAIAAAAELTGGQSDVSNVSPMPMGTPTTTQAPVIDEVPIGQAGGGMIPPGATPVEVKPEETYEQNVEAGGLVGQRNTKTGEFKAYPGQTGGRITRFNPETGQIEIIEGSGADTKAESVAKAQEQMKGESFRLNQANTEEAFGRLDVAGTNNPLFAAGNSLLAKALPASEVGELESFFERINGENSFAKMNQLRASSPTGGAAGTMTEKEWPRFEGRFSPLKANAKKDTLAKSLSLNLLNAFEAANGTPDDVIKLLNEKKIDQAAYDNYVNDYIRNRQIARVTANGVEGKSYDWTRLNKKLLSKSTIFEAPSTSGVELLPDEQQLIDKYKTK